MNLAQDCLTEMYTDVKNLINQLSWKAVRTYGGDFEEVRSEALLAFCKAVGNGRHDPARSKLTTHTYFCVWKRLQTIARSEASRNAKLGRVAADLTAVAGRAAFDLEAFAEGLSEDARHAVLLLEEFGMTTRKAVRAALRAAGWTESRIVKTFTEVQGTL